jgi:hypothetical protein
MLLFIAILVVLGYEYFDIKIGLEEFFMSNICIDPLETFLRPESATNKNLSYK